MSSWIDFKELREKLDFGEILRHHGVELKLKGAQHLGYCPLPCHNGKRNSQSFSANLERKIFHCFGCHRKGNALDFAVLMDGGDPKDGRTLKRVALDLRARFCPPESERPTAKPRKAGRDRAESGQLEMSVLVNQPLDFDLKDLDSSHPYLTGRGFAQGVLSRFGVGYCARGWLADRIAIPLHDRDGRLIGYAGRVVSDAAITNENPRYLFPGSREREGTMLEFRKSQFLYNGHRIKGPVDDLGVVEGFTSVWWLHQQGFPCSVATMGAECSDEQAELIVSHTKPRGRIWLLPDGDKAGEKFALSLLEKLSPHRFVRWVRLENGRQPTDLEAHEMRERFMS